MEPYDYTMAQDWEFRDGVLPQGTRLRLIQRVVTPRGRTVLVRCVDEHGEEHVLDEALLQKVAP